MTAKTARFIGLLLTALALGAAFAHALEMPNKRALSGPDYLLIQQHLYEGFGNVLGPVEYGALLSALVVLFLVRGRRTAFFSALIGAICIAAALVVWQLFVSPVNQQVDAWTALSLPTDWMRIRDQWEYAHAARAVLFAVALGALAVATLNDAPSFVPEGATSRFERPPLQEP